MGVAIDTALNPQEVEACRKAFSAFDADGSGTIDVKELKSTLQALGQKVTDEEVFVMISQVDEDGSGEIEFQEFLKVIENQKQQMESNSDESDTIEAFVALGGSRDKSGKISAERLATTIKEFELTIDIDALIRQVDRDQSNEIDFAEFKLLLSNA